jgi:hypothetical protein
MVKSGKRTKIKKNKWFQKLVYFNKVIKKNLEIGY